MQIFLFSAGIDPARLGELERRVRSRLPEVRAVSRMDEITKAIPRGPGGAGEFACILFPVVLSAPQALDRMVAIATEYRDSLFFIFISDDIPASDYKRLVQTGGADWASTRNAPDEIAEIITRIEKGPSAEVAEPQLTTEPVMVAFLPSAGGVGNGTLALEVGVQLKKARATRSRRVCLVDLDFQNSHVCDFLDIEPRMQIHEIAGNPDRLDTHLFEMFVSHHGSGLDVLATPRSKDHPADLDVLALEALFRMISTRYDLILLDLPVHWFGWTRQLLSAVEVAFVVGLNTIPGLRQVAETLKMARGVQRMPPKIAVVLNRCEHNLVGGIARRNHATNLLAGEEVHFVREDNNNAVEAANTGIPMSQRGGKVSKDIAALVQIASEAKAVTASAERI